MRHQTKLMVAMMESLGVNPAVAAAVDGSSAWQTRRAKRLVCSSAVLGEEAPHGVRSNLVPTWFCSSLPFKDLQVALKLR
jgi:hypothetical protein